MNTRNTRPPGAHNRRRLVLPAMALMAALLYTWQVASAWSADLEEAAQQDLRRAASVTGPRGTFGMPGAVFFQRSMQIINLQGTGIAAGATGSVRFNERYGLGELRVQDMPVLLPSQVYRLWCIDVAGTVDASSTFKVPSDGDGGDAMMVTAPRPLSAYRHFRVTIESLGSEQAMSGTVVMSD